MTDQEVNKIIAEYMRYVFKPINGMPEYNLICHDKNDRIVPSNGLFTESLDALVPVWEKLAIEIGEGVWINFTRHGLKGYHLAFFRHTGREYNSDIEHEDTPQQAAAHATAKAIQELR